MLVSFNVTEGDPADSPTGPVRVPPVRGRPPRAVRAAAAVVLPVPPEDTGIGRAILAALAAAADALLAAAV